uniref:Putative glycine rich protein n=1 Tax=Ixodes ricinus TaxID=34613 RepID=A0A0K8RGE0_IXORI
MGVAALVMVPASALAELVTQLPSVPLALVMVRPLGQLVLVMEPHLVGLASAVSEALEVSEARSGNKEFAELFVTECVDVD